MGCNIFVLFVVVVVVVFLFGILNAITLFTHSYYTAKKHISAPAISLSRNE